jgi:hypothetical protein
VKIKRNKNMIAILMKNKRNKIKRCLLGKIKYKILGMIKIR